MTIVNLGSSDEILRASLDSTELANSAHIAFNRGFIIFRGPDAQREIRLISDTATTPVSYSEVF